MCSTGLCAPRIVRTICSLSVVEDVGDEPCLVLQVAALDEEIATAQGREAGEVFAYALVKNLPLAPLFIKGDGLNSLFRRVVDIVFGVLSDNRFAV